MRFSGVRDLSPATNCCIADVDIFGVGVPPKRGCNVFKALKVCLHSTASQKIGLRLCCFLRGCGGGDFPKLCEIKKIRQAVSFFLIHVFSV